MNLIVPFDPKMFVKGLLFHCGKKFEHKFQDNYWQVAHQQYIVKIYNKSFQYEMGENVLRFEIKFVKMKALARHKISTLNDLSPKVLLELRERLIECLEEIVYYDYTISTANMQPTLIRLVDCYSNPRYWFEKLQPHRRDKHKKKLSEIIEKNSKNLRRIIRTQMESESVIINQSEISKRVIINHSNIMLPNYIRIIHSVTR